MIISFYEEFPTKKSLDKLRLIKFPTRLIVAAKSIKEFHSVKNKIKNYKNNNINEVIYWPVLEKEEGYWFSAFSGHSGLKRIINEIKQNKKKLKIMWDAELPLLEKSLFFTQLPNYFKNKELIIGFFNDAKKHTIGILTSEYPLENKFFRKILSKLFVVSFDTDAYGNKKIVMLYTSFLKNHANIEHYLEKQIKIGKKSFGNNLIVGLGCIGTGILGNEPLLTPEELDRDLRIVKESGINEAVIFRLGGLNGEYIKVTSKYAD